MIFTTFLRRNFSLLIAVLVIVSLSSPAYSSELSKNKNQLQSVSSQLKKTRQKINQAKKQEKNLAGQINVIDRRIESVQVEYNRLDDQLDQVSTQRSRAEGQLEGLQKDLYGTQKQLEEAEIKLSKQKIALNQRLEGIYKRGETGYIEFILSSDNFTDLLNRMRFMEIIMNQDINIIDQVESTKNEIEDTKLELEQERKSINDKRTKLVITEQIVKDLTKKKMAQKEVLSEEIDNKQNVLQQIQEDRAAYELAEDQLLQQSKSLTSRIRDLEKKLRKKNPSKLSLIHI
jgi:peptidoglycan hydrolase CwlO-like protein